MCHWGKQRAQPTTRRGSDMSTHTSFLKANSTVNPHLLDGMRCCCLHENITTTTWTQETTCKPRNVAQMTTRIRILYTHILIYNLFIYSIWSFKLAYLMCRFCKQKQLCCVFMTFSDGCPIFCLELGWIPSDIGPGVELSPGSHRNIKLYSTVYVLEF